MLEKGEMKEMESVWLPGPADWYENGGQGLGPSGYGGVSGLCKQKQWGLDAEGNVWGSKMTKCWRSRDFRGTRLFTQTTFKTFLKTFLCK